MKMIMIPHPPTLERGHMTSPRNTTHKKLLSTTQYFPRRIVPINYQAFGTYYSSTSATYDLCSLKDYFNWQYKLAPRLAKDKRPIWK